MSKIALVTGGNRSIGRATALALAEKSTNIIITYKEKIDDANKTIKDLEAKGIKAAALQLNLSQPKNITPFIIALKEILTNWGSTNIDFLINNAGTLRMGVFDKITEDDLDEIFTTNYKSQFLLTQALLPILNDGGRIVNLGSGTASIAFAPLVAYGPLKAALQSLTLYLASFLGNRKITVNAVAPGGLDDDFNAPLFSIMPQAKDYISGNTAMGRIGLPVDVSEVIVFLCSDAASFISGAVIPIDGGYHL